jgi:rhodanese-related sulfurtransferase
MTPDTGSDSADGKVREIQPADAIAAADEAGAGVVFLDVREQNEWNLGHIPGAVHIPRGELADRVGGAIDPSSRVVVYCAGGSRATLASEALQQMGYRNVESLKGGIRGWAENGGEIED